MSKTRMLLLVCAAVMAAPAGCLFTPASPPVLPSPSLTNATSPFSLVAGETKRITCKYDTTNIVPVTAGWASDDDPIATVTGGAQTLGDCSANVTGVSSGTTVVHFAITSMLNPINQSDYRLTVIVTPGLPTITSINAPPAPVATVPFAFTLHGTNFDRVSAEVRMSGPGCGVLLSACDLLPSALTHAPPDALSGTFTAPSPGQFTFTVRNGSSGTPSNGVVVSVGTGPTPTLISIAASPPQPPAQTLFTYNLVGNNFDVLTAQVVVTGPGCTPSCTAPIGNNYGNAIDGAFTPSAPGTYSFSVRNGPTGTLSNSLPVVVGAAAACVATVVIADAFEAPSSWKDSLVAVTSAGASDATSLQTTGGNPGGFRQSVHTMPPNGSVSVIHRLESASYNPASAPAGSGPIKHIDYAEDQIVLNPPFPGAAVASQFFIQQGTTFYFKSLPAFSSTTWTPATALNLTPADFTPAGLDFSAAGGVMHFGYLRANSNTSLAASTRQHGIDNFKVTICQ
jgi:hypothetical protein